MMPFGFSARPVQIATLRKPAGVRREESLPPHAPCRLQRGRQGQSTLRRKLYLHTLRADCNDEKIAKLYKLGSFASTRSVQIATFAPCRTFVNFEELCLHTLRADCNVRRCDSRFLYLLCLHTLRADCNGRNAQNCNMHFSERVLSW